MKDKTLGFYSKIYEPLFKKGYTRRSSRATPALKKWEEFSEQNSICVSSVIDVGCAWGKTLAYWRKRDVKAIGVDVAPTAISYCKKKGYKCKLLSATNLYPFKDNSFDLYMATDVYEHLRPQDVIVALSEARRVTRRYFLIRPHPALDKRKKLHLSVWSLKDWQTVFETNGFNVIPLIDDNTPSYQNVFLLTKGDLI